MNERRPAAALAAAVLLGLALRITEGHFVPGVKESGLALLLLAAGLAAGATLLPSAAAPWRQAEPALIVPAAVATLLASLMLLGLPAGLYLFHPVGPWLVPLAVLSVAGAVAAVRMADVTRPRALLLAGLLTLGMLLAGAAVINASPWPSIDVFVLQERAAARMVNRLFPYVPIPPDLPPESLFRWPPGLTVFPYTPLSLLLALPGFLLGDVRWSLLLAGLLVPSLLALLLPVAPASSGRELLWRRAALLALLLFAVRPVATFLLEQAFNESFAFALLVGSALLVRGGKPAPAAVLFGLAVSAKQYLLILFPFLPLFPGITRRHLLLAAGVFLAPALPFLLVDPRAVLDDTVRAHFALPPRYDALTLLSWAHWHWGKESVGVLALLPLLFLGLFWWREWGRERSVGGPVLAMAATLLAGFLFSKQAHANYYDLAEGLLLLGAILELTDPVSRSAPTPSPPP